jgi:hypothetical protein
VTEKKNAFDGLIMGLETAEERISELKNMSIETSKTEKERRIFILLFCLLTGEKWNRIPSSCGTATKVIYM